MDTLIVPCIVLTLTTIIFALLAERQRRETRRLAATLDQVTARSAAQRQQAYNDGLFEGWKRGWSESYTAATKAERQGRSPIEAIHRVGALNAPALLGETTEQHAIAV